jgi:hypothetical protein
MGRMTEAEWRTDTNPDRMLAVLRGKATDRKVRLFLVACARSAWGHLTQPDMRQAVEVAERFADGRASEGELREQNRAMWGYATRRHDPVAHEWAYGPADKRSALRLAMCTTFSRQGLARIGAMNAFREGQRLTGQVQPALLRDVFGPLPFRGIAFPPAWRSPDAAGVAAGIYEDRAFDRLPLLADALMDAGCGDEDILGHCRSDGPHVRGCWVVDLVLGKE